MASRLKKTNSFALILLSIILLFIGILFCFNVETKTVSIIIGVALCMLGGVGVLMPIIKKEPVLTTQGILYAVVIAFGIAFIVNNFLQTFIALAPYLLICIGSLILIDGIIYLINKDKSLLVTVIEIVIGSLFIAFGLCIILVKDLYAYRELITGILFILGALFLIVKTVIRK